MEKALESFKEIKEKHQLLKANLLEKISVSSINVKPKAPFTALGFAGAVMWRSEELTRRAIWLMEQGSYSSAALLCRAVLENTAVLNRLNILVGTSSTATEDVFLKRLHSLAYGWKKESGEGTPFPTAINIIDNIRLLDDELSKRAGEKLPKIAESMYYSLSEVCHPNWSAVMVRFPN